MPETNVEVERLRKYSENDAIQLGSLMSYLSEKFTGEPVDKELLKTIIESPYHDQLVARMEGRIIGAATMSLMMGAGAGKKGHLEDFIIEPDMRRQGIGSKIWSEMMNWCREQEVDLEFTSSSKRTAAHNFYIDHGAQVRETSVFNVDIEQVRKQP